MSTPAEPLKCEICASLLPAPPPCYAPGSQQQQGCHEHRCPSCRCTCHQTSAATDASTNSELEKQTSRKKNPNEDHPALLALSLLVLIGLVIGLVYTSDKSGREHEARVSAEEALVGNAAGASAAPWTGSGPAAEFTRTAFDAARTSSVLANWGQ